MSMDVEVSRLKKARKAFSEMQRNWWEFAKNIYEISKDESYKEDGHETFKDFCEYEFPSMHFKTIIKYVSIVDKLGSTIEEKIKKDEFYCLPAYEACYSLVTLKEDIVTREELSRMKRDVFEKKLSYYKLRDQIKELTDSKSKVREDFIKKSEDEIGKLTIELEAEIDEEIDGEVDTHKDFSEDEDEEYGDNFHGDIHEDLEESDYVHVRHPSFNKAIKLASELFDELELVDESLNKVKFSKEIERFAIKIDKTYTLLDQLLEKIEEMQSREDF